MTKSYEYLCGFKSQCLSFQSSSGLPLDWEGEPHIAVNPKPQSVQPGAKCTLRCVAFGNPAPQYQWYRNGQPLQDKTSDILQVRKNDSADSDYLHCYIYSDISLFTLNITA